MATSFWPVSLKVFTILDGFSFDLDLSSQDLLFLNLCWSESSPIGLWRSRESSTVQNVNGCVLKTAICSDKWEMLLPFSDGLRIGRNVWPIYMCN